MNRARLTRYVETLVVTRIVLPPKDPTTKMTKTKPTKKTRMKKNQRSLENQSNNGD
jgi:hypothetical protein